MRLSRIASHAAGDGACRATIRSKVCLGSSRIARSRPGLREAARLSATGCGWFESGSRPSASSRRGAGSIVSTSTLRPAAAAAIASAALEVVLPTPPGPTQITRRRPSSGSSPDFICEQRLAEPAREPGELALAQLGPEQHRGFDRVELRGPQPAARLLAAAAKLAAPKGEPTMAIKAADGCELGGRKQRIDRAVEQRAD